MGFKGTTPLSLSLSVWGMAWWDRVTSPMRRVWAGVAIRLGMRKSALSTTGLTRLREEVNTCEYEDVHVMWELLTEARRGRPPAPRRRRWWCCCRREGPQEWGALKWSRFGFCRRF